MGYYPHNPCWVKMRQFPGSSKIRTLVWGGSIGGQLKPKDPFRKASVDMRGFNFIGLRRLRASTTCRVRQNHKCNGNLGSRLDNLAIKWCLNVCIYRSAMRARCRRCGNSGCWAPSERMKICIPAENSLSSMCRRGWQPRSVMCLYMYVSARRSS